MTFKLRKQNFKTITRSRAIEVYVEAYEKVLSKTKMTFREIQKVIKKEGQSVGLQSIHRIINNVGKLRAAKNAGLSRPLRTRTSNKSKSNSDLKVGPYDLKGKSNYSKSNGI